MLPQDTPTPIPASDKPLKPKSGCTGSLAKLVFFSVLLVLLLLPFTRRMLCIGRSASAVCLPVGIVRSRCHQDRGGLPPLLRDHGANEDGTGGASHQ